MKITHVLKFQVWDTDYEITVEEATLTLTLHYVPPIPPYIPHYSCPEDYDPGEGAELSILSVTSADGAPVPAYQRAWCQRWIEAHGDAFAEGLDLEDVG